MIPTSYTRSSHNATAKALAACAIGFAGGLWAALLLPGACQPRPATVPPAVTVRAREFVRLSEFSMRLPAAHVTLNTTSLLRWNDLDLKPLDLPVFSPMKAVADGWEYSYAPSSVKRLWPRVQENENAMLWAISQIESGGKLYAIGDDWTRFGKYQMSQDIIARWCGAEVSPSSYVFPNSKPQNYLELFYRDGRNPDSVDFSEEKQTACALLHLHEILAAGATTPQAVYKKWNPNASDEDAKRVENLYNLKIQQK